ncbi:hypothetical protein NQ314_006429 [Rhamnusium bicolor]|uniref:Uncharacterized protein n=1 Tax=Rhamnusium bicolor TaxID=1586634 RepID=A0AAV8Z592_9CUCU|nr:hypothetical protein NQ314_006429 [Rhamnusium bicolor]
MSYKATVSNLKKHMIRKHPTVQLLHENVEKENDNPVLNDPEEGSEGTSVEVFSAIVTTVPPHQVDLEAVASTSKCRSNPFSVVQDESFRQYTKALNPAYEIPTRQVISKTFVPSFYEECLVICKEKIKEVQAVSLTTDCWTSGNNDSFIGITIHFVDDDFKLQTMLLKCAVFNKSHISANLSDELNTISEEWGVNRKVVLAVSDNAANIASAIKNGTNYRKTKLTTFQENVGDKNPKKLLQDVVTRWNSTFYMIERFVILEEAVRSTVALLDTALPQVTVEDWGILKELKTILEPFEDATCVISGQQYLVPSLVIVITGGLLDVCQELLTTNMTSSAMAVIKKLQYGLRNRLGNVEYSNTLAITTFLDPRYKTLPFKNNDAMERVKKNIISELADEISNKEPRQLDSETSETTSAETEPKKQKFSIWTSIDKIASQEGIKTPVKSSTSKAVIEVQRYMEEDILDRKKRSLRVVEGT